MNYEIRHIEVPMKTGVVIEYYAENLCKLIEAKIKKSPVESPLIDLVVLERWGSEKRPDSKHRAVILKVGEKFEHTVNYEPILSRRGKFQLCGVDHYLFQI